MPKWHFEVHFGHDVDCAVENSASKSLPGDENEINFILSANRIIGSLFSGVLKCANSTEATGDLHCTTRCVVVVQKTLNFGLRQTTLGRACLG